MSTLFLEAFGQLSDPATIDCEEEDLYSVFLGRSRLMGWGAPSSDERPLYWAMEEAEITADTDPYRIGWVQVGLDVGAVEPVEPPTKPLSGWSALPFRRRSADSVLALPTLVQCFNDSLSRFGVVELSGLQVTAIGLEIDAVSRLGYLVSVLNWFNTDLKARADAIVSFEHNLLGDHDVSELVASLQWRNTEKFEFRSAVDVPEQHMAKVSVEAPSHFVRRDGSGLGVWVMMPEWTPSAAGWVLASVIDAARAIEQDVSSFVVRVTRLPTIARDSCITLSPSRLTGVGKRCS